MTSSAAAVSRIDGPSARAERPIVVGIDGSPGSVAALRWAASEARAHGRPLTAVVAYDVPAYYGYPLAPVPELDDAQRVGGEACLDKALADVYGDKRPPEVRREVQQGNPARVLIDIAEDASLLVVGARGHGHFLLGSVSDRCMHHAACPVVVVRG
jgi:nucleotide-binding universal stress UspA family protein